MRKLCWVSVSLSLAVFLSYYLLPVGAVLWLAVGCSLMALPAYLLRGRGNMLTRAFLCLLGAAIGFAAFTVHWSRTLHFAELMDGSERRLEVRVIAWPQSGEHYVRLQVETVGKPRLGVMLYDYSEENADLQNLKPGDLITAEVRLRRADLRYGERNDSYVSRDIYLTGTLRGEEHIPGNSRHSIRTCAAICSKRISDYVDTLFSGRTAVFMRSLMLGDKTDFYQDLPLYASMRGAGFMHIVAVSGMHIAFLVGMIQLLFGARPASSIAGILLMWFFVFMTGASPSAVRAGIMQTVLLMAPIFRRENDGPTSLAFALSLILLINPFSCASISLQLSFSAMAGMVLLAGPMTDILLKALRQKDNSPLRAPVATIGGSIAVLASSTPFSVLHFGTLAIWSPLTNLLGLWAVSLCFCGGYLSCLAALLFRPMGTVFVFITDLLAKYLISLAGQISRIPHHLVGMRNPQMLLWLALCYALGFVAWRNRKTKGTVRVLLPALLCVLTLASALYSARRRYTCGDAVIAALDVGQGECVCVLSENQTVMLDCGGIGTLENAGETAAIWLESAGRDRIDLLVLSHLHEDHANGVPMLLELIRIETIILSPDADYDEALLPEILESAERHGTKVIELTGDEERMYGRLRLQLFAPPETGSENERCVISLISIGEFDLLFTGDALKQAEMKLIEEHTLPDTELLIVGHHGSKSSSAREFLTAIQAEEAIISVGRNNSYGHPTTEVLRRLANCGYRVYRTDLNGTIELRVAAS